MDDIKRLKAKIRRLKARQALISEQLKGAFLLSRVRKGLAAKYMQQANELTGAHIRLERLEIEQVRLIGQPGSSAVADDDAGGQP